MKNIIFVAFVCLLSACGPEQFAEPAYEPSPGTAQSKENITGRWVGQYSVVVDGGPSITVTGETFITQRGETATLESVCPLGEGKLAFKYTGTETVKFSPVICRFPAPADSAYATALLLIESGSGQFGDNLNPSVTGKSGMFKIQGRFVQNGEIVKTATLEFKPSRGY